MARKKLYSHKVTISDKRRTNKKASDLLGKKGVSKKALTEVFNSYYKDQVRALYRSVTGDN